MHIRNKIQNKKCMELAGSEKICTKVVVTLINIRRFKKTVQCIFPNQNYFF